MSLIKRIMTISLPIFFSLNLSACFMMPFMFGGLHNDSLSDNEDPKLDAAANELIEESVAALDGERGLFDQILVGEIKLSDDLISVRKFRQILLESLRRKNMWQVLEQDGRADSALKSQKVLAVLNSQFYQTGDRIWLAQQLVDMRTNRIIWSGIYARPLVKPTQHPEDAASMAIGS